MFLKTFSFNWFRSYFDVRLLISYGLLIFQKLAYIFGVYNQTNLRIMYK